MSSYELLCHPHRLDQACPLGKLGPASWGPEGLISVGMEAREVSVLEDAGLEQWALEWEVHMTVWGLWRLEVWESLFWGW